MSKHTPEPWRVSDIVPEHHPEKISIDGRDESFVALVDHRGTAGMQAANAERIVACVNACAGIDDPAAAIQQAREALIPFALIGADLTRRLCHIGLCAPEQCGECGRVLSARAALQAIGGTL